MSCLTSEMCRKIYEYDLIELSPYLSLRSDSSFNHRDGYDGTEAQESSIEIVGGVIGGYPSIPKSMLFNVDGFEWEEKEGNITGA